MCQVDCSIPLEVRLAGRLTPERLADLGAAVEKAVASRLAEAEEAVAAREEGRRRRGAARPGPNDLVRELYDPEREDRAATEYDLPSYQAGGTRTTVPVRSAGGAPRLPPVRSFADEWQEFVGHVDAGRTPQALAAATRLAGSLSGDDAVQHAGELALWLLDHGEWELAQLALRALESAWWTRHVVEGGSGVPSAVGASLLGGFGGFRSFGSPGGARTPRALLDRAKQEAAAGRTDQAFALFELAFLFVQMQLARYYEERTRRLDELDALQAQGLSSVMVTILERERSYGNLSYLYGLLREILGFYPRLEREALARGDVDQANVFASLGFVLRETLRDRALLDTERVLTMESERTTTPRGPGYRIFGARGREEVVEPLPGTPPPSELGAFPSYYSTLENVVGSVAGQEQFVTDLYRHPEVVAEFGSTPPDMSNRDDPLRVWSVMYRVFQRGSAGFGSGLGSLLDLMERYLQVYTRHTVYNIRDFGVSYLTSEFPQDLVGRTVQDCGVYALTVAYELYLTARRATPRVPVSFRLYSLPEHASLAIFDLDQDTHFIVNNDRIDGPFAGGPGGTEVLGNLARIYGVVFERPGVVAPTLPFELGTTAQGEASFRTQAWQRYLLSTQWGFATPPGTATHDVYERYYEDVARFGQGMRVLQARIDRLQAEVAGAAAADRAGLLRARLPDLAAQSGALMRIFEVYGPDVARVLATQSSQLAGVRPQYLFFFADRPGRLDPLTRLGRALLFLRSLGGRGTDPATGGVVLAPPEDDLLRRLGAIPFMQADLQAFLPGPDF